MISGLYSCLHPYINKETGVVFTCGQCFLCRRRKAQEWIMRCSHELQTSKVATFLTLTYKPRNLRVNEGTKPENEFDKRGSLFQRDMQLFFKRLRKLGYKFKYFYCGEYGSLKWRPHYHCVLFGLHPLRFVSDGVDLEQVWSLGHVDISSYSATEKSIAYIVGYVSKKICNYREKKVKYLDNDRVPPYIRCSHGLGADWCDMHYDEWSRSLSVGFNGRQMSVPRYYMLRVFRSEGLLFKRINTRFLDDGSSKSSLQYVVVKNPYGPRTSDLISKLHHKRLDLIDKLSDYDLSDSTCDSLSSKYRDYSIMLLRDVYSSYDFYSRDLPDVEHRFIYVNKKSEQVVKHPLLSDCENKSAKSSVGYKLLKVSRGVGNRHEFFDCVMDLEELHR